MKVRNPNMPNKVAMRDIENGVVFCINDVYHMKIVSITTDDDTVLNCVSLVSGIARFICPSSLVTPVDGEFVVKKVNA